MFLLNLFILRLFYISFITKKMFRKTASNGASCSIGPLRERKRNNSSRVTQGHVPELLIEMRMKRKLYPVTKEEQLRRDKLH